MAEEKAPARSDDNAKILKSKISHVKCNLTLRFVPLAAQSRSYRRTE